MILNELVKVPFEARDHKWESQFFNEISKCKLRLLSPDPQEGPDGFPYLLTATNGETTDEFQQILHWAYKKGIGLVINPEQEYPDFVFTYGMLWSFKETGYFYRTTQVMPNSLVELKAGANFVYGEPSEQYLPVYARNILREFFRDQGLLAVKLMVFSEDQKNFDLLISIDSLGNPPTKEHDGIAEAISWFLPPHYSIALVHTSGLPEFYNL